MKILMLYGTTEGQTRKIAEFVAKQLTSEGDTASLVDAAAATDIDSSDYDAAVIAASIDAGRYQTSATHLARANCAWLNRIPSAFISVSLAAAGDDPEDLKAIAECAERFKSETGWSATEVHQVAGAFRFTEYDFFKRWVMKLIAWGKGVKVEPGKDLELTSWAALAETVDAMRARFADSEARKQG